jgi:photosystem II stability/assembly factor-like uncharacterized protein
VAGNSSIIFRVEEEKAMKSISRILFAFVVTGCLIAAAGSGLGWLSNGRVSGQTEGTVGPLNGVDPSFLAALEWRFVGPLRGGRSIAVAGDPRDPLVFYFGSTHGGVWKTDDGGTYWRNVSDGFFKTSPVGAIDVSLSNPAVVYVGMGEVLDRQDTTPGDGVYRSTDGGQTWVHVGLKETRHIAKVRIHPTNPDIVYVAAAGDLFGPNPERGVYRTRDGGKTWQRVLYKSERAGAFDLAMDPANPQVLYASLNQFQRLPWDQISGGPDSGLYKSTDGGDSWAEITHNAGLPRGDVGKIGIAVSPPQPNRVWALVQADDGALFRSDDGGNNWQRLSDRRDLRRSGASYMHIVADTQDPDTVYVPAYSFQKSTDGGKTFTTVPMLHGDHHALWIDPKNPRRMIEGSDGGATVTLNGGLTWSTLHNQPTAELFGLAVDDEVPYRLYAEQNDNTCVSTPSRTDSGAIAWTDNEALPGGEGGQTAVKPDGSVVYAADGSTANRFNRYSRRTGQAVNIIVWPDDEFTFAPKDLKYRFFYDFPVLLSPHDPNVLYTAGNRVFRTTDEGNSWETISPDLTRNRVDKMQKIPGGPFESMWSALYWVSLAQALAESPLQKGELWVGTDDSTVQMTRDGGKTWQNVSPKDLPEWTTISGIDVSPHDRGTVYLAAHRYRVSDLTPYFYKTTDYGRTWRKITTGIRENDFARVIREDPVRPGLLYAGTDTGAYVSFDAGASWQSLQLNLPAVAVAYMQVKNNDLVVTTHGRGFWILDNLTALRQITREVAAASVHLFEIAPTRRYLPVQVLSPRRSFRPGIQVARSDDSVAYEDRRGPDGRVRRVYLNAGQNPPGGVMIDYYLKQRSEAVTLTILDGKGQVIKQFSSQAKDSTWLPAEAGMNRFVWDMRYPGAREIPVPADFVSAEYYTRTQPPIAPPGRYSARLSVGGQQYERPFEIQRDPRITATDDDLRAQFELMVQIHDRLSQVTDAVERLRTARRQLEQRTPADARTAGVKEQLGAIEGALTRLLPAANPMVLPPKGLNNRLAALSGAVQQADARPTRQMYAVFEELSAKVVEQLRRLDEVLR